MEEVEVAWLPEVCTVELLWEQMASGTVPGLEAWTATKCEYLSKQCKKLELTTGLS